MKISTSTMVVGLLGGTLLLAGCPNRIGVAPQSAATIKVSELPAEAPALVQYADGELAKLTRPAMENALVAVDKLLSKERTSFDGAWRGARACAFLAEEFPKQTARLARIYFAERGVQYAQTAITAQASRVEGHYWLGINQGLLATSKHGIRLAPRVREAAEAAIKLDERYDFAGPLRLLGTFFAQAPPELSKGDVEQGVRLLHRAIELAPEYPQNHLHLADALVKDDKFDEAVKSYEQVLAAPSDPRWAPRLQAWKRAAEEGKRDASKRRGGGSPF